MVIADQLHGLLIHADDGTRGVVWLGVHVQDLLHMCDKISIFLWRNDPAGNAPIGHLVF